LKPLIYILTILTFVTVQKISAQTVTLFDQTDGVSGIVMPNVFTPNYDSINDVFKPLLDEITEMEFTIFNRYGNLIFETNRLHGFWDGRTTSGEACTDGVYFCILSATGVDGKKYKEKTFVQLFAGGYNKQ
jgi:gliding motility-associated-like protein